MNQFDPYANTWCGPSSALERALAELRELEAQGDGSNGCKGAVEAAQGVKLPLAKLKVMEVVFQNRNLNDRHIGALRKALGQAGDLEPVLVIELGTKVFLIDGHHRRVAYMLEGRDAIPVDYFQGTLKQAVAQAAQANSRDKLAMTNSEKQNAAWRLVLIAGFTKAEIVAATGVSNGQVGRMRAVKKSLGKSAWTCRNWFDASNMARGVEADEWTESKEERLAREFAERLSKEFGGKLRSNPVVAAMALRVHFGSRFPDLLNEFQEEMEGLFGEEQDELEEEYA